MTTVTAKKLRDNLSNYLDRLQKGEEIIIIRHSEIIGVLKPTQVFHNNNGSTVSAMLERNRGFFQSNNKLVDNSVSSKDLYHKALDEQFKQ